MLFIPCLRVLHHINVWINFNPTPSSAYLLMSTDLLFLFILSRVSICSYESRLLFGYFFGTVSMIFQFVMQ
jgi:hypothetical protein